MYIELHAVDFPISTLIHLPFSVRYILHIFSTVLKLLYFAYVRSK